MQTRKRLIESAAIVGFALLAVTWLALPAYWDATFNDVIPPDTGAATVDAKPRPTPEIAVLRCGTVRWQRDFLEYNSNGHVDLPRLQQGQVAVQGLYAAGRMPASALPEAGLYPGDLMLPLALFQNWPMNTWFDPFQRVLYQSGLLHKAERMSFGRMRILRTQQDLERLLRERHQDSALTGTLLGCAGLDMLETDLERIRILYHAGYRLLAPAYLSPGKVCGIAGEDTGLTPFGKDIIRFAEQLKLTIDLAHSSAQTVDDVLALSTRPVLVSLYQPGQLRQDQLKTIAARGGLIGISLTDSDPADIGNTLQHLAGITGASAIALGGGFDEGIRAPFDVTGLKSLIPRLEKCAFSQTEIQGIMGRNMLQFLQKNLPSDTDHHNVS